MSEPNDAQDLPSNGLEAGGTATSPAYPAGADPGLGRRIKELRTERSMTWSCLPAGRASRGAS